MYLCALTHKLSFQKTRQKKNQKEKKNPTDSETKQTERNVPIESMQLTTTSLERSSVVVHLSLDNYFILSPCASMMIDELSSVQMKTFFLFCSTPSFFYRPIFPLFFLFHCSSSTKANNRKKMRRERKRRRVCQHTSHCIHTASNKNLILLTLFLFLVVMLVWREHNTLLIGEKG